MMATRLCCTALSRSTSPQDAPPRPLKHWRSMAVVHYPPVNDTSRQPLAFRTSDDLELHRIFVSASLPEDHPDALRIPGRKPSLDQTIIRSPSFSKKIHRQLSRRSLASAKTGLKSIRPSKRSALAHHDHDDAEEESILDFFKRDGDVSAFDPDALSLELDEARLVSLQFDDTTDLIGHSDVQWSRDGVTDRLPKNQNSRRGSLKHQKSFSMLGSANGLESINADESSLLRRTRSTSTLKGAASSLPDMEPCHLTSSLTDFDASWQSSLRAWLSPLPSPSLALSPVPEQSSPMNEPGSIIRPSLRQESQNTFTSSSQSEHPPPKRILSNSSSVQLSMMAEDQQDRPTSQVSDDSVHLYDMHISQHLRSQSQQSDVSSFNGPSKPWNRLS